MSRKKKPPPPPVKVLLDLNAGMDMSPDETSVIFEISSGHGAALTAQAIVDAVVDMTSSYFGVSKEEWEAMANEGLDS